MASWWLAFLLIAGVLGQSSEYPIQLETKHELDSGVANIHLTYNRDVNVPRLFTYGPCDSTSPDAVNHEIARHDAETIDERLVWVIPDGAEDDGCLVAWSQVDNEILGKSKPLNFHRRNQWRQMQKRDGTSVPMRSAGLDNSVPWFDGVAKLNASSRTAVDAKAMKDKKIAIVGAGMSGLMTYLNLYIAGFRNVEIIEASQRLGGRVQTTYFDSEPFDYQYQEMGAMRFPKSVTYSKTGETLPINDQKLVFQLAEVLNMLNENDPKYKVDFAKFIQFDLNSRQYYHGTRMPDGTTPTFGDTMEDESLGQQTVHSPEIDEAREKLNKVMNNPELLRTMAVDMFKAFREFLDSGLGGLGGDDYSEFAYMHNYLKYSLNATDITLGELSGYPEDPFFIPIFENMLFTASDWEADWLTVDGGVSRLAEAFRPLIKGKITFGREIEKIDYLPEGDGKVKLSWKNKFSDREYQSETYDYAVVSAPFSVVRRWSMPSFSPSLRNAIDYLAYAPACKAALHFRTRFWEHIPNPIYGSATTFTDLPGIGMMAYPSYNINGTGPGSMLSVYALYQKAELFHTYSDEEYAQIALDATAEIHGEVAREEYTGKYDVNCWNQDRYANGGWANPSIGQQKNYMPSYFNTENNIIFVGEHTSYMHAWVSSALESAVRGSVQLLLQVGLVDEAKATTKEWMARWINI